MAGKAPAALICLSPNAGGMELAALKLAVILSERLPLTMVVKEGSFLHRQATENPDYASLDVETIPFRTTLGPSIIFRARRIVRSRGCRNVIFLGASELKSLYFAFLGLDINLIVRHGTNKSRPKKDPFHRLIYSGVAAHVAISTALAENVRTIVPFGERTRLEVIHPSLSKPVDRTPRPDSDTLRLLHVGRITPGKGLADAMKACGRLDEAGIPFTLDSYGAMAPDYRPHFEALHAALPYRKAVRLNGFTDDIYRQYALHDLFIFPSYGEGFGNVVMEALAHGMITVVYDNTSMRDFRQMGFHIHLVEDRDTDALGGTLLKIARQITEERRKAEENRERARTVFSPEREAAQYLALLR